MPPERPAGPGAASPADGDQNEGQRHRDEEHGQDREHDLLPVPFSAGLDEKLPPCAKLVSGLKFA